VRTKKKKRMLGGGTPHQCSVNWRECFVGMNVYVCVNEIKCSCLSYSLCWPIDASSRNVPCLRVSYCSSRHIK
jgi:hypothetical protein